MCSPPVAAPMDTSASVMLRQEVGRGLGQAGGRGYLRPPWQSSVAMEEIHQTLWTRTGPEASLEPETTCQSEEDTWRRKVWGLDVGHLPGVRVPPLPLKQQRGQEAMGNSVCFLKNQPQAASITGARPVGMPAADSNGEVTRMCQAACRTRRMPSARAHPTMKNDFPTAGSHRGNGGC